MLSPRGFWRTQGVRGTMWVRIFTLKFDPVLGGFDDGEVRDFLKDKEVLPIRDHFFIKDEIPYLAVLAGAGP